LRHYELGNAIYRAGCRFSLRVEFLANNRFVFLEIERDMLVPVAIDIRNQ